MTLRAGTPVMLDTRNNIRMPSDVSPDGKQIAYFSIGEHQEDIFIGSPDGPMRRVTDDAAARPRAGVHAGRPVARVLFEPGRQMGARGSSALTAAVCARSSMPPAGAVYVFVSPKGDAIVFAADPAGTIVLGTDHDRRLATATQLPGTTVDGQILQPDRLVAGRHAAGRHAWVRQRTASRRGRVRSRARIRRR